MERFPSLPFGLHVSGPLLEWMEARDTALLDLIARRVDEGQCEIIGGGFGEPILPMIPHRDRIGQIVALADWIERRFGVRPRGAWLSERVWEAGLASTLAEAGVEYTFLDDSHFLAAGRDEAELRGTFVVEDGGRTLRVFPISERLRYDIPFATVPDVLAHLREEASRDGEPLLCYADDGEKFGVWPETHEHCYEDGWLPSFLEALEAASDEIRVIPPGTAIDTLPPRGRVYLPDSSYREMNEWTLPIPARRRYEEAASALEAGLSRSEARGLLRGGVWRNFLVHYPESNLMVSRMLRASDRIAALPADDGSPFEEARLDLYRGQCNCAYWHGIFGGLYLPHLRSAIYRHLLRADRTADRDPRPFAVDVLDHDCDGNDEVVLETPVLSAVVAPARGARLVDLSLREAGVNLLNVLARRPEYEHHELERDPAAARDEGVKTIHDTVIEDVEGYRRHLEFDVPGLESCLDRLTDPDGREIAGLTAGRYEIAEIASGEDHAVAVLRHIAADGTVRVGKSFSLADPAGPLRIDYEIEPRAAAPAAAFLTVELSLGIPGGDAYGRHYRVDGETVDGNLLEVVRREDVRSIDVVDDPAGISVRVATDRPGRLEADPIQTVSRSEAGFELIFQAARLRLSWRIPLAGREPWRNRLDLATRVG
jgi:alpha-amylase